MRILGVLFLLACGPDAIAPAVDSPVEPADTSSMTDSGITDEVAGYESAEACAECHPVHYDEWRQSMHAYAAKSPVFDAMAAKAYRDTAGEIGTFCTGCHSPFGDAEGEGGALVASQRSDLSRADPFA